MPCPPRMSSVGATIAKPRAVHATDLTGSTCRCVAAVAGMTCASRKRRHQSSNEMRVQSCRSRCRPRRAARSTARRTRGRRSRGAGSSVRAADHAGSRRDAPGTTAEGIANPCLGRSRIASGTSPASARLNACLVLSAVDLKLRRNRRGELDELVIEQRHARLDRVRHAHPVHLGQDVERQIRVEVRVLERESQCSRRWPSHWRLCATGRAGRSER
jgi:hypothetical protein